MIVSCVSFNCPMVVIRQCNHKNNDLVFKNMLKYADKQMDFGR